MKFLVTRTSLYSADTPPCPGAVLELLPSWDVRTFKTPAEHDARFPAEPWLKYGTEHTTWSGGIRRRLEDRAVWTIDIPNLLAFVAEHGHCILEAANPDTGKLLPSIEIYDDYRE